MPSNVSDTVMVVTGKLNSVNDGFPGSSVADISGVGFAPGQIGKEVVLDALGLLESFIAYDTAVGTLYEGKYKYIQLASTDAAAPLRGSIAFWKQPTSTTAPYVVTGVATDGNTAGVFINPSTGAKSLTPGNFGFIQIEGIASVLFNAALTNASPANKDLVVVKSGANTADDLTGSTTMTAALIARKLGIAEGAAVAGAISLVKLFDLGDEV